MKKPLFEKIKDFIKQQIEKNIYLPNQKIPTEIELAEIFKTSRQTVNKALRDLVLEDIIVRFPRSGTFVKPKIAQTSILELKSISKEIEQRGNQYNNKLLSLDEQRADSKIAKIFHMVKDQKIYVSKMLHFENGVPVRFDMRYINPLLAPEYIKEDFSTLTPSQYLQKNCPVQKVDNSIEAMIPQNDIRKFLDISIGEPCLLISRLVISKEKVASYSKLYYPSSRYKLNSTFAPK
ncbi:MAG: GntR family transcriptional regulator [Campylobacteraceae bacterium]|nr:GntR family transcriptional regulator [Campylobacteraceae bacterium]